MVEKSVNINIDYLKSFTIKVFESLGVPSEDSKIVSEILAASDLRGITSHGVQRLKMYYNRIKAKQTNPITKIDIIKETPTTALIDGNLGMGHVISYKAMNMAIEKAKKYGMGSVAVKNSTHFGIAGYYPLMATKQGCVGLTATNARPTITPTFGVEPQLGTNPLAYGFPTDEEFPFILDCATSIAQRGKIEVYDRINKSLPEGWVISNNGEYITDATEALNALTNKTASLLPLGGEGETLGGHKGYGYATVVELLSAAFQQGMFLQMLSGIDESGNKIRYPLGHFFMAIDVEAFCTLDDFKKSAGDIMRALRKSNKAPGKERIFTAGEKEFESEKLVNSNGLELNKSIQEDLKFLKTELNLDNFEFNF